MEDNRNVLVTNRDSGTVSYTIEDRGIRRIFVAGETKKIPFAEIQALQYIAGGDYMLRHLFMVKDLEVLDKLNIETEPEYFYTEADVKKLLLEGTVDQLEDALNFSPDGVLEIIKKLAVELEIPDIRKRNLITEKTGFNVNNAINVNAVMAEETPEEVPTETKKRKAAPITTEESAEPKRKAAIPTYNVVKEG